MQIDLSLLRDAPGAAALIMLGVHVVVYANKEGKKDQRLLAVEEKVKTIDGIATTLASVTATMDAVTHKLDDMKSDLRSDIHELRSLMSRS
jgi:hypothetical protein